MSLRKQGTLPAPIHPWIPENPRKCWKCKSMTCIEHCSSGKDTAVIPLWTPTMITLALHTRWMLLEVKPECQAYFSCWILRMLSRCYQTVFKLTFHNEIIIFFNTHPKDYLPILIFQILKAVILNVFSSCLK